LYKTLKPLATGLVKKQIQKAIKGSMLIGPMSPSASTSLIWRVMIYKPIDQCSPHSQYEVTYIDTQRR
jgi:hypothetical protein